VTLHGGVSDQESVGGDDERAHRRPGGLGVPMLQVMGLAVSRGEERGERDTQEEEREEEEEEDAEAHAHAEEARRLLDLRRTRAVD